MSNATCEVTVLDCGKEFFFVCDACRTRLAQGRYVVGLDIVKPNETIQLLLGATPPIICCGEDRKVLLLFNNKKEAHKERERLIAYIQNHGKEIQATGVFEGFTLMQFDAAALIRRISQGRN